MANFTESLTQAYLAVHTQCDLETEPVGRIPVQDITMSSVDRDDLENMQLSTGTLWPGFETLDLEGLMSLCLCIIKKLALECSLKSRTCGREGT
jgi:hypothetical protein